MARAAVVVEGVVGAGAFGAAAGGADAGEGVVRGGCDAEEPMPPGTMAVMLHGGPPFDGVP